MHGKGFKGSGFLFLEVKGRESDKGPGGELMERVFHGWAIKLVPLVSLYLQTILFKGPYISRRVELPRSF